MWRIAALFPLALASFAQTLPDSAGITVDAGGALLHRAAVVRPASVGATGDVVLEASVNATGEVIDARVLSGPVELRRAALESVLQWHYSTEQGLPQPVRITIHFGEAPAVKNGGIAVLSPTVPAGAIVKKIVIAGVTPETEQRVRARLPVREGDAVTSDTVQQAQSAAREIDEHFQAAIGFSGTDATLRVMIGPAGATRGIIAVPVSSQPAAPIPGVGRIKVDGQVQAANLVSKVNPLYPPLAKQARIQGVVHLTAIIGTDGAVRNLQVISGHPLLVPPALEAVRQWTYQPTLQNGKPVEVVTTIDVNFTLAE